MNASAAFRRSAVALLFVAGMAASALAQNTTIGVGSPAPVVPRNGLLGTYYSYPAGSTTPPGNPPGSPDTTPATQAGAAQFLQRIDPSLTINFQGNAPPGNANGSDWFMVVWEGRIVIPTAGTYTFYVLSDDGERSWFGTAPFGATPNLEFWVQRGVPATPDTFVMPGPSAVGTIDTRLEMEQGNGGVSMQLQWSGPPSATRVDIPSANLLPPAGPNAVTPTATPVANNPTPAINISWPDSATPIQATSWILSRGTAAAGPFTQIAVQTTRNFADAPPAFGTYYYIVQGTAANGLIVGNAAAPVSATAVQPQVSVSPAGPIVTSEAGQNAILTLTINTQPNAAAQITITSTDATEANLSAPGVPQGNPIIIDIPNGTAVGTTIQVTVHGLDDPTADGTQPYKIQFAIAGGGSNWTGLAINDIDGTNTDNDTPGITVTPISNYTTESGGTATFSITFNTAPTASTDITVTSNNTAEVVVTSVLPSLTFDAGNYSTPHVVTLTGVDDAYLDFLQPFTITVAVASGDPAYTGMAPILVSGANQDNEPLPVLPHVWGKGGCGLTGLEVILVLGLGAAWRRRRNR